jgi:hypothetical protein
MKTRTRYSRRLLAVVVAVITLAAPARAGIVSDDASGFLRDRPPTTGRAPATGTREIVHEFICAEDCVVSGRIVVAAREAPRLGLGPVEGRWLELGRFQSAELEARTWRALKVRLGRRIERRLRRSSVRVRGEAIAISLQSRRHGQAGWAFTYGAG